jgi:hypothetical protein
MERDRPRKESESTMEMEEFARGDGQGWVFAGAGKTTGESCAGWPVGEKKNKTGKMLSGRMGKRDKGDS